ncbi:MAG TPA: DUF948 domain-containing protein [Candidatus Sericytochromatia bacterium]
MIDPLFWLGLSILLVAVSLTAVLIAALPALQELGRAARSIEKLADTLRRELPPTLEAIRLTGLEISDLTDDVSEGVKSAGQVVKQVDQSISGAKNQAKKVQVNTRGVFAGVKAAWKTWNRPSAGRRSIERLPPSQRAALELREREASARMAEPSSIGDAHRERDVNYNDPELSSREASGREMKGDTLSPRQYEGLEPSDEDIDY